MQACERDETNETNGGLITGKVIDTSLSKKDIVDKSKVLRKAGFDVAVISTIESLEKAISFVYFDNGLNHMNPEKNSMSNKIYKKIQNICNILT